MAAGRHPRGMKIGKAAALLRKALGQTASFRKPETSVSPEFAHGCSKRQPGTPPKIFPFRSPELALVCS